MFLPSICLLFAGFLAAPILPVANGAFWREMWRCAGCRDADGSGSKGFWLGGGGGPRAANRGRRRMMNGIDLVGGKTMTDEDYWDHHHEMKEKDGTEAFNSREMLPRMKLPSAMSEPALAAQGAFGALIDNMVERQVPNGWADPDTKAASTGTLLSPQRRNTVAGPRRGTGAPQVQESEEDAMYSHWGRLHALRYDIDTTHPRFSSGTADANGNGSAAGEGADVGVRTPAAPLATASVPVATGAMPQQNNIDTADGPGRRATNAVPPVATTGGPRAVDSSPSALFPPPPGDGCTTCSHRSSCREDQEASDCGKKDDGHCSNGGAPSWQNPRPGTGADQNYSGNLRPAPGSESVRSSERKTRHTRRALSKAKETEADRAEAERVDEAAAARVSSSSPRNFEEAQEAQVGGPSDHDDVADVALTLHPVATPTPAPLASSPCIWDDHVFRILPDDFYASIVPPTREPLPPSEAAHAFPMLRRANAEESRQGSMSSTVTPYHGPHHLQRTQSNDTRSQRTSGASALLSAALLPGSRFGTDLRPAFNGSAEGRSEEIPPSQSVSGVGSLRLVDVDPPTNVNESQGRSPSMSTSTMGSNFTLCARSQARLQHHRDHTDLVYVQHNTGEKRCTPVYFLRPPHLQVRDSRDDGARYAPAPDHRHEHAQQPCCHSSRFGARVSQHYEEPGAAPPAASAVDIVDLAGFSGGVDGHAESLPGSQMSMQEFLLLLDAYNLGQARVVLSPVAEIACILLSDEDAKKCFHYALILQLVPRQFGCEKCCGTTGGKGKQKTESGLADAPAAQGQGADDTPARRRGNTRTDGSCNHGRCYSSGNVRKHQQPRPPEQDVTSRGDAAGAASDAPWMSQWAAVEESPPHDADFRVLGVRSTSSCAPQPQRTRLVNVDGVGLVAAGETEDKVSTLRREREEVSPSDSDYTDDELRQATAPDPSLLMTACSHPRAEPGIILPKASCGKRKVRDREAHTARALVLAGRSTSSDTVNEAGRSSDGLTASLPTYGLDERQLSTPEDTTPTNSNSNCQEEREPRGHAHETEIETDAGSGTGHQRREQDESGVETLLRLGRLSRLRNSCSDVSAVAHCRADYTMECERFNYRMRNEFVLVGEYEKARGGCGFTSGHLKELKKKAAQRQHRCYCAGRRTAPRPAGTRTAADHFLENTEPEAASRPAGAAATSTSSSSSSPEHVDDNAGANAHFHEERATQAKPSLRLPLPCAQSVLESSAVSRAAISDAETETTAGTPSLLSASRESYYSGSTAPTSSWGSSASRSSRRPSTSFMTLTPEEDGDEMMDERNETEMPTTGSKERETPIAHKKAETKAKTCTCSCPDPANIDHPPDHLAFVRIERLSTGEIVFKYMFQPDTADPNNDRVLVLSTEHVARVWEVPTKYGRLGQPIDARDWLQEEALLSGWHTDISRRDETGQPLKLGDVHCGYDLGANNCQHLVFRFFRDVLKVPACGVFHSDTAETVLENYRMEEWEVEQPVGGGGGRRSRARGPLGVRVREDYRGRGNYESAWGSAFLGGGTKRPWPERVVVKMRQTKIDPINLSDHPLAWSLGLKARDELCDKSLERLACIRKFEEFQLHMAEGYHHKEDPPLFGCGRDLNRFTLGDDEQQG